jgi:hypothetical protein
MAGHTVFSLSAHPSQMNLLGLERLEREPINFTARAHEWYTEEQKNQLDLAHLRKIDASEAVVFLNTFGYIGKHGLAEWEYCKKIGRRIYALQSWGKGQGIGENHNKNIRDLTYKYLGVRTTQSPVDTHHEYGVWTPSLLGPGGSALRLSALDILRKLTPSDLV